MLSALIRSAGRQPAVPLAGQLAHESCVRPGPLVLGTAPLKSPTPVEDRDRHVCYRAHLLRRGPGHFCLALHVAMQVGPYLHHAYRPAVFGIWSLRIPDATYAPPFLLIVRTGWIFTARRIDERVPPDTRSFQHIAEFIDSRESTVSRRSKPSSRTALMGEQPNPWKILHLQDATSRHRGAKPCRRCGRLGKMSLLSPGYLLSVNRPRFHMPRPGH